MRVGQPLSFVLELGLIMTVAGASIARTVPRTRLVLRPAKVRRFTVAEIALEVSGDITPGREGNAVMGPMSACCQRVREEIATALRAGSVPFLSRLIARYGQGNSRANKSAPRHFSATRSHLRC
jgi:hypothetical protein